MFKAFIQQFRFACVVTTMIASISISPLAAAQTLAHSQPPLKSSPISEEQQAKDLLSSLRELMKEVSELKLSLFEQNIFGPKFEASRWETLKNKFQILKTETESHLAATPGDSFEAMTVQEKITNEFLQLISQFISIDNFLSIHQPSQEKLLVPTFSQTQQQWHLAMPMSSFFLVYNELKNVPKELQIKFSTRPYNDNPLFILSLNNDSYFKNAMEALTARVNKKTHLESFKCLLIQRNLKSYHSTLERLEQNYNKSVAAMDDYCLGLPPTEITPDVFSTNTLDYSVDEAKVRALLANNFDNVYKYFSKDLTQALNYYVVPLSENSKIFTSLKKLYLPLLLFPEKYSNFKESQLNDKALPAEVFAKILAESNEAFRKFLGSQPQGLWASFKDEPLKTLIDQFVQEVEKKYEVLPLTDQTNDIYTRLQKAEAFYLSQNLFEAIQQSPLNLAFLTKGSLDATRKRILANLILQAQYASQMSALSSIFSTWLGDEHIQNEEIQSQLNQIVRTMLPITEQKNKLFAQSYEFSQWAETIILSFQKQWQESKKQDSVAYIQSLLPAAADLRSLFSVPLENLNISYDKESSGFSINHLFEAYKLVLPVSDRLDQWMKNIVFQENIFRDQKQKIQEVIQFLEKRKIDNPAHSSIVSQLTSYFSDKKEDFSEEKVTFSNQQDQNDYDTLLKLEKWLGYNFNYQPLRLSQIKTEIQKQLNEEEIKTLFEIYRKYLSYNTLSNPQLRFLDYPLTIDQKTQPLYEWLSPYNSITSLGAQGIDWLKKALNQVSQKSIKDIKILHVAKTTREISDLVLFSQSYNLMLGDEPFTDTLLQEIQQTQPTIGLYDFSLTTSLQNLSMLHFHKKVQQQLKMERKLSENQYDQLHTMFHDQFWTMMGVSALNFGLKTFAPTRTFSQVLSHFVKSNQKLVRGYWAMFTFSAGADIYYRSYVRQPQIDAEKKLFEEYTYAGLMPPQYYDQLVGSIVAQTEHNDDQILMDWIFLGFPIGMRAVSWLGNKFFASKILDARQARLLEGGEAHLNTNYNEFARMGRRMEMDLKENLNYFSSLGIDITKVHYQDLWSPAFLKTQLLQLKELKLSTHAGNQAYRNIITHIYQRISPFEQYPTIFERYLDLYLGKNAGKIFQEIKTEYGLIYGVKL